MLKTTIKFDTTFLDKVREISRDIPTVVASITKQEFDTMLYNTPQYTGNFVANMRIQAGSRRGSQGGDIIFPVNITPEQAMKRGSSPAISYAMSKNSNVVGRVKQSAAKGYSWSGPLVTVYNLLDYAPIAEGYEEYQLRKENRGGAHPIEVMKARLQARFATLQYGSVQWKRYAKGVE